MIGPLTRQVVQYAAKNLSRLKKNSLSILTAILFIRNTKQLLKVLVGKAVLMSLEWVGSRIISQVFSENNRTIKTLVSLGTEEG